VRIVLDTNVLVSALISKGTPPALLYEAWSRGDFQLVTSAAQIDELRRVLAYDRLRSYIAATDAQTLSETISAAAVVVEDLPEVHVASDEDDNAILATAIASCADLIVTGDKSHLLTLESVEGIPIVTPRAALDRLGGGPDKGLTRGTPSDE
jgi:hypothetical protein